MALRNETVLTGAKHPGTELKVLQSRHGWYLGYLDTNGQPYSRESKYFNTKRGAHSLMGALRHA